jgi:integrase
LSQKAIDAIESQAKMLKSEYNQNLDLIFPSEDGIPMPPNSYYTAIRRMGIKAGVHVSPHMFRHTFTYYTRNMLSLKDLQNALGHEESTTTLDIYGNMLSDNSTDTANAIDAAFNEIKKKKVQVKPITHLRRIK